MEKLRKIGSVLICATITIVLLLKAADFYETKVGNKKYGDFYTQKSGFDVLFLGTSHMTMGVSPMELWRDYGITSYNLANHGQWLPVDYWALKNALDYVTPKLVVIDVHAVGIEGKYFSVTEAQIHELFDVMPLSKNKVLAVKDLLPKDKQFGYLFNLSYYHGRWNEIDGTFWDESKSGTKGTDVDNHWIKEYATVASVEEEEQLEPTEIELIQTIGREYLEDMIELCKNRGIGVLLIDLPYMPSIEEQKYTNSVQILAADHRVDFLNFNYEKNYLNFRTDMFDRTHLNSSGMKKTTKVLGEYIKNNYDLPDHRTDEIAVEWKQDYKEYLDFKVRWLKHQVNIEPYMMLLADDDFDIVINLYNREILEDTKCVELLANLGIESEYLKGSVENIKITIENGIVTYQPLGEVEYKENIHFTVMDSNTGKLLDSVGFNYTMSQSKLITAEIIR